MMFDHDETLVLDGVTSFSRDGSLKKLRTGSSYSQGCRAWEKKKKKKVDIVVAGRSAVVLPFLIRVS